MARKNWILHPADRINVARGFFAPVVLLTPFWYGIPEHYSFAGVLLIFAVLGDTGVPYDWEYGDHAGKS